MKVFGLVSFFGAACSLLVGIFFLWFFPWVLTFHTGFLVYFPYEPNGISRYSRSVGPLTSAWSQEWIPSEKIPNVCKLAVVASEDTKFYQHHGLDLESLEQSYKVNKKRKKLARGGSTLTQQLVKNAFLSRDKTYLRKVRELVGAVLLDASLSKDHQLTWYLNIVEFGPRIYGLNAAAQHYFKKEASKLSKDDCVALAAILPAPNKWNKSLLRGQPTGFFASRTSTISKRMFILNPLVAKGSSGSRPGATSKREAAPEPLTTEILSDETLSQLPDLPEDLSFDPEQPSASNADAQEDLPGLDLLDPSDSPATTQGDTLEAAPSESAPE